MNSLNSNRAVWNCEKLWKKYITFNAGFREFWKEGSSAEVCKR